MGEEGWEKTYYTLGEILTTLKRVIAGEKMFDIRNPSIVLCLEEVEKALDQKALHVNEVWDFIMGHLIKVPSETVPLHSLDSDQQP